jgi:hypothetical protein
VSFSRQQAGIQDLTIEFPLTPYRGMGREAGFNAIYFWSVVHCWVKNVAIINADMAVTLDGTHFCTVSAADAWCVQRFSLVCGALLGKNNAIINVEMAVIPNGTQLLHGECCNEWCMQCCFLVCGALPGEERCHHQPWSG